MLSGHRCTRAVPGPRKYTWNPSGFQAGYRGDRLRVGPLDREPRLGALIDDRPEVEGALNERPREGEAERPEKLRDELPRDGAEKRWLALGPDRVDGRLTRGDDE